MAAKAKIARLHFSLSFLLWLIIPFACASLWIRQFVDQRPIAWEAFSEQRKTELVESGETVVLFCKPSINAESYYTASIFEHREIRHAFNSGSFRALLLVYSDWQGAEIRSVFRNYGHTKDPIVLLFKPGEKPIPLDPLSESDIKRHLARSLPSNRWTNILLSTWLCVSIAYWIWRSRI